VIDLADAVIKCTPNCEV